LKEFSASRQISVLNKKPDVSVMVVAGQDNTLSKLVRTVKVRKSSHQQVRDLVAKNKQVETNEGTPAPFTLSGHSPMEPVYAELLYQNRYAPSIWARFTVPTDESTVTASMFYMEDFGGQVVDGTVTVDDANNSAIFTQSSALV
jgi:hypothetical protein